MHSPTDDGEPEDDLYTAYSDLYSIADKWLADGAALHLDDIIASITILERLDQAVDMDMVEQYGPLVSGEPTVRSVVEQARGILMEHFTRHHLNEAALRQLRNELRGAASTMQKAIGQLESRTADIDDLGRRIAMRKQIHAVSDLQKRIRGFANMLSALHELRWEDSFSGTRVRVTPKQGTVCRPLQSGILQVEIPDAASLAVSTQEKKLVISVEGPVLLSVAGRPDVKNMAVAQAVIDRAHGVKIVGRDREILLTKKGTKTEIQVKETG